MVVGINEKNNRMGKGYLKDSIAPFAQSFQELATTMLTEAGVDIFSDAKAALRITKTQDALKKFFINESADYSSMTPEEIEEHNEMMLEHFELDRESVLEHTSMGANNPVIGLTLPMHKNLLMQDIWTTNGGIQKAVAASPKFTLTMEYRIFVDKDGNEFDMYKNQEMIHESMKKVNPLVKVELTKPGELTDVLAVAYPQHKAGLEHLDINSFISAVTVKKDSVTAKVATNVQFTPGYNPDFDRMGVQSFEFTSAHNSTITEAIKVSVSAFVKGDKIMYLAQGVDGATVESIEVSVKLDSSSATQRGCSVTWKEKTDIVEIGSSTPITVTIAPQEVKDSQKLYNVNQLSKVMSLIKDALGNDRNDGIKEEIDRSFETMPEDQKVSGLVDFKERAGYASDHVTWRHATFMDTLDTYATDLLEKLNDPNMTISVYGRSDIIRKIAPTQYVSSVSPDAIGPVNLEFTKTVTTSDKRTYQFISSQKIGRYAKTEAEKNTIIVILKPTNGERIVYRVYDYQFYVSNDIRAFDNPALPAVHAFDRWKFVSYQPVQGRIRVLNPNGHVPTVSE